MSTKPLGPPAIIADDPGPWSVVSSVFAQAGRPGRRRPPAADGAHALARRRRSSWRSGGLDPASPVAGVGPVRVVAAAREPAFRLEIDAGRRHAARRQPVRGARLVHPGPHPDAEERPPEDPTASLPPAVPPDEALREGAPSRSRRRPAARSSRSTRARGATTSWRSSGSRTATVVRWIRAARAAAWTPDGRHIAIGGPWGVLLAESVVGEG